MYHLRTLLRNIATRKTFSPSSPIRRSSTTETPKVSNPLRILFCGSDGFSSASLRALHAEQQKDPAGIASIDVLCRPGKPAGRNLKSIREVPIKAVAEELGLQLHQRDTFTGWELPRPFDEPINLIIAVSFGLFVPPRILKSVEYGGLNVHPSLLPNYRGPAPLHHMILKGATSTGVTLQTLDDKSFDHGLILAQTPQRLSKIPNVDHITYEGLLSHITPMATDLLVRGIRERLFVPPLVENGWYPGTRLLTHAPKITATDREINWLEWNSTYIDRRARALGRLWNRILIGPDEEKRFIFEDAAVVPLPAPIRKWFDHNHRREILDDEKIQDGTLIRFIVHRMPAPKNGIYASLFIEDGDAIIIAPNDLSKSDRKQGIRVKEITVEGFGKRSARQAMNIIEERKEWFLSRNGSSMTLGADRLGTRVNPVIVDRKTYVRTVGHNLFCSLRLAKRSQKPRERRIKSIKIIKEARERLATWKAQETEKSP